MNKSNNLIDQNHTIESYFTVGMHNPVNHDHTDQCESDKFEVVCPTVSIYCYNCLDLLNAFLNQSLTAFYCCFFSPWCSLHLFALYHWRHNLLWVLWCLSLLRCFNLLLLGFSWDGSLGNYFLWCLNFLFSWRWLLKNSRNDLVSGFSYQWLLERFGDFFLNARSSFLLHWCFDLGNRLFYLFSWGSSFLYRWLSLSDWGLQGSLVFETFDNFL